MTALFSPPEHIAHLKEAEELLDHLEHRAQLPVKPHHA